MPIRTLNMFCSPVASSVFAVVLARGLCDNTCVGDSCLTESVGATDGADLFLLQNGLQLQGQLPQGEQTHTVGHNTGYSLSALLKLKDQQLQGEQTNSTGRSSGDSFSALSDCMNLLPSHVKAAISKYYPVFDFDGDSCLPAAAISRSGQQNGGLKPTGSVTGGCRSNDFMSKSNTYHRGWTIYEGGNEYQYHVFDLYFQKDQTWCATSIASCWSHRHDVETVLMYFKNGNPVSVGTSAHGDFTMKTWSSVPKDGNHPKIVYNVHGARTHTFRFASSSGERAENPSGAFQMPPLASWSFMTGDGKSNSQMRQLFGSFDFGDASFKVTDGAFWWTILDDKNRPADFPICAPPGFSSSFKSAGLTVQDCR